MTGPDVVGSAEARALMGNIGRQRFHVLSQRADFPAYTLLALGRVYDRAEIVAWHLSRPRGPLARKPVLDALRAYRASHTFTEPAHLVGVHPTTVATWMRRVGAAS